jgi:hypothetical protein
MSKVVLGGTNLPFGKIRRVKRSPKMEQKLEQAIKNGDILKEEIYDADGSVAAVAYSNARLPKENGSSFKTKLTTEPVGDGSYRAWGL